MIIIEGCDATGKSTLAKWLANELNFEYFKDGFHRLGVEYYINNSLNKSTNIVSDRFHLGEYVYPVIKKDGRKPLELWEQWMIENILLSKKSMLILCHTSVSNIYRNFDVRGEDFITKENIGPVCSLFIERYSASILPKITFDYTWDAEEQLLDTIKQHLASLDDRYPSIDKMKGIGCSVSPDVMLVGEGQNLNKTTENSRAFSHYSASSIYLHRALGINKDLSYYLTNANKVGGDLMANVDLLKEEVSLVCPQKVIALGNLASHVLEKANIEHSKAFHPSFWKRFHFNELNEYADLLR